MTAENARRALRSCAVAWLMVVSVSGPAHADPVGLRIDSSPATVTLDGFRGRELRLVFPEPDSVTSDAFRRALDSLGFFSPSFDTGGDTIRVDAGVRATVGQFLVKGDTTDVCTDSLEFPATPCPFDAATVRRAAEAVLHRLGRSGFPFASVSLDVVPSADGRMDTVTVVFVSAPGERFAFGPPVVRGLKRTRGRQIARDLQFVEGDTFDYRLMTATEQRLQSRRYLDSARVQAPQMVPDPGADSAGGMRQVVVPVAVWERSGLGLDGAVGFEVGAGDETRLTGTLDFSLLNAFGVGERIGVRYRGDRDLQRLHVALAKTHLGSLPVLASGSFSLEIARDDYGHIAGELAGRYELTSRWRIGLAVSGQENSRTSPDSLAGTWHVYGLDLLLDLPGVPWRRGRLSRGVSIRAGSGLVDRGELTDTRWVLDFAADAHIPLGRVMALAGGITSLNLFTDEQDLTPAELYRVGGHGSVRGYAEDQLALCNVAYAQLALRAYFSPAASVYIFTDGGVGFREGVVRSSDYQTLFGYGLGVSIPVRIGSATLEWARNIEDTRGLGRVHVRITNRLAYE